MRKYNRPKISNVGSSEPMRLQIAAVLAWCHGNEVAFARLREKSVKSSIEPATEIYCDEIRTYQFAVITAFLHQTTGYMRWITKSCRN